MRLTSGVLLATILAGALCAAGCSNRHFRQAMGVVGEEAAYAALKTALVKAGVRSADHMVDAVRLVADNGDYGGAVAAFAVALEEHNVSGADKLTSGQVIALMRRAGPAVRSASRKVGNALDGFCDYAASHS